MKNNKRIAYQNYAIFEKYFDYAKGQILFGQIDVYISIDKLYKLILLIYQKISTKYQNNYQTTFWTQALFGLGLWLSK